MRACLRTSAPEVNAPNAESPYLILRISQESHTECVDFLNLVTITHISYIGKRSADLIRALPFGDSHEQEHSLRVLDVLMLLLENKSAGGGERLQDQGRL
jgi:hypothetical protein